MNATDPLIGTTVAGYRLVRPLPGHAWRAVHPERPGKSYLILPDRYGRDPHGALRFRTVQAWIIPLRRRIPWVDGEASVYAMDGWRLLDEVPSPLPWHDVSRLKEAWFGLLDAAERRRVGLDRDGPARVLWGRHGEIGFIPAFIAAIEPDKAVAAVVRALGERASPFRSADAVRALVGGQAWDIAPPGISADVAAVCSIGGKRVYNEDAFGWRTVGGVTVVVVADGMGVHRSPREFASALLVDAMLGVPLDRALEQGFRDGQASLTIEDGLTTCTAARVEGRRVSLLHVGDSRAYRVLHDRVAQVTSDHTLTQRMMDIGRITAAQAAVDPMRNVLLRAVSVGDAQEPDRFDLELRAGERLLICTDGLHGTLDDRTIGRILGEHPSIRDGVAALHDAALMAGATDNLTMVLVDPERPPAVV